MSARPDPDPRVRARVRRGAGAALILVLAALGVAVLITALAPRGATTVLAPGGDSPAPGSQADARPGSGGSGDGASDEAAVIYVHVLGAVARPGLYLVRDGSRAVDAIAAAGGLAPDADPAGVNLARFVGDGEQLVVPRVGEVIVGGGSGSTATGSGLVNVNTADVAALDTLPRIGPAIAARIVAWRDENGRFTTVDDLLEVTGIGPKLLDQIRDLVTT